MQRTLLVVVDASRARIFTLDRTAAPEGLHEELVERRDFINPARRQRGTELFSDAPAGAITGNGRHYGFDDHRAEHLEALDRAFSREVTAEAERICREQGIRRLIVCASPAMLGELRNAMRVLPRDFLVEELARDLVKLTPSKLRAHLGEHGLLPAAPPRLLAREA